MKKGIEVKCIPSIDQLLDVFTKVVQSAWFNSTEFKLRVEKFPTLSLRENVKIKD